MMQQKRKLESDMIRIYMTAALNGKDQLKLFVRSLCEGDDDFFFEKVPGIPK
jgi:hypothetical protein